MADVREDAVRFYEGALKDSPACCAARNAFAASSGYDAEALVALPADAAANSFGCGDPLAFANVQPGQTVLDLGSGAGIDLLLAAGRVGPKGKVIGVDLSEIMIERARTNATKAGFNNIELRRGAVEDLPVESASVDWVISNCVINLSPDKARVFSEIHRALRPGGRLLVSDMIAEGLPDWIVADPDLRAACICGAVSEREYLDALRAAGFVEADVIDRFTYDEAQISALIDELLPASLASLANSSDGSREAMLNDVIAATHGRVQSLRIKARRP